VICYIAIENDHRNSGFTLNKMVISHSYVNVYERVNPRSELGPTPSSTTNVATNAKNAEWAFVGALPNDPTLATLEHPTGPSQQYPENHSAKNPHRK
jgi:hypothetical protein